MYDWKCPLCGSNGWNWSKDGSGGIEELKYCFGCSVAFYDPERFNHKKMIEEKWNE
jgi:hypothetical protein